MTDATAGNTSTKPMIAGISRNQAIVLGLLAFAVMVTLFKPWLPGFLDRLPDEWIPPWADWLDAGFSWLQNDLGLIHVTREISSWLGFLIDAAANLLYGKSRWPRFEAIPWSAIAAVAAVTGYYLGGWKLAVLAGGTFIWTAVMGQWKWTMETMSVIVVAAPVGFIIGMLLGI